MTAGRDAEREELAAALTAMWEAEAGEPLDELDVFAETRDNYVDTLLPVVDRIANVRAAAALEAAADDWARALPGLAEQLRSRAAALRASNEGGAGT